jgi:hypothetical protein
MTGGARPKNSDEREEKKIFATREAHHTDRADGYYVYVCVYVCVCVCALFLLYVPIMFVQRAATTKTLHLAPPPSHRGGRLACNDDEVDNPGGELLFGAPPGPALCWEEGEGEGKGKGKGKGGQTSRPTGQPATRPHLSTSQQRCVCVCVCLCECVGVVAVAAAVAVWDDEVQWGGC